MYKIPFYFILDIRNDLIKIAYPLDNDLLVKDRPTLVSMIGSIGLKFNFEKIENFDEKSLKEIYEILSNSDNLELSEGFKSISELPDSDDHNFRYVRQVEGVIDPVDRSSGDK